MSRSGCFELLTLACVACGDPLADLDYAGAPLFTATGEVLTSAPTSDLVHPTVGIIWGATDRAPRDEPSMQVEVAFPNWYSLDIFQPPPQETRHVPPTGAQEIVAIGLITVYEDVMDNGAFDPPDDRIVGTASRVALTWKQGHGYAVGTRAEDCTVENRTPPMLPADPDHVNIVIGINCEEVIDPDCNGETQEWGPFCSDAFPGPGPGPEDTDRP